MYAGNWKCNADWVKTRLFQWRSLKSQTSEIAQRNATITLNNVVDKFYHHHCRQHDQDHHHCLQHDHDFHHCHQYRINFFKTGAWQMWWQAVDEEMGHGDLQLSLSPSLKSLFISTNRKNMLWAHCCRGWPRNRSGLHYAYMMPEWCLHDAYMHKS